MSARKRSKKPELKICGITTIADLRIVAQVGADFFGTIVDIPRSPRSIAARRAHLLGRAAGAYSDALQQVLVVEKPTAEDLADLSERITPSAFQIHAHEAGPEDIEPLRVAVAEQVELWFAVGIPPGNRRENVVVDDISGRIKRLSEAGVSRVVLDTRTEKGTGGTGQTSNWEAAAQIVQASDVPVMLAGGINPGNVTDALTTCDPAAIDVSSGVEKSPGRKDPFAVHLLAARFEDAVAE